MEARCLFVSVSLVFLFGQVPFHYELDLSNVCILSFRFVIRHFPNSSIYWVPPRSVAFVFNYNFKLDVGDSHKGNSFS